MRYFMSVLLLSVGMSFVAHGQSGANRYIDFKGNRFETVPTSSYVTIINDPITGDRMTKKMDGMPTPVKMNGKPIYDGAKGYDLSVLKKYMMNNMDPDGGLKLFANGMVQLTLSNIVIDEQGHVVYYDIVEFSYTDDKDGQKRMLSQDGIAKALDHIPALKPVMRDGAPVPANIGSPFISVPPAMGNIALKDHRIY